MSSFNQLTFYFESSSLHYLTTIRIELIRNRNGFFGSGKSLTLINLGFKFTMPYRIGMAIMLCRMGTMIPAMNVKTPGIDLMRTENIELKKYLFTYCQWHWQQRASQYHEYAH